MCTQNLRQSPGQPVIDQWFRKLANGKFEDIVYPASDKPLSDEAGTPLATHLDRLVYLASHLYRQTTVPVEAVTKVLSGLNFYAAQDYQTSNWWSRQIGLAKPMCRAAVLLTRHLDAAELMTTVVPNAMKNTTTYAHTQVGANLADFASIQLIWGICAWKNSGSEHYLLYLRAAADVLSGLCLPVSRDGKEHGEGICVDYSFSQHNPKPADRYCTQLYSGSYGRELTSRIIEGMTVLKGSFLLDAAALAKLTNLIVLGMGWTGYAGRLDNHTCGRGISNGSPRSNAVHAGWALAMLPYADDANKQRLNELIIRAGGDESQNQYYRAGKIFWVNDYMSYIGEKFCLWAKAISTRTVGGESGNGANRKGYYVGSGTYFLTRHGNEYEGIQPVWDWQRLPGTTVEQVPDFTWPDIDWGKNMWGSHDFVGGVSDGKRCMLSMELSRKNVTHAYKTVMALGNQVICMGTRINSQAATHPVITSVNQCNATGPVRYMNTAGEIHTLVMGESVTMSTIHRVYHDGFVYEFENLWHHPSITVQLKIQTGKWSDLNTGGSSETVEYPVFSLWINHHVEENSSYIYTITAADDFPRVASTLPLLQATADFHLWQDDEALLVSCFNADLQSRNPRGEEATFMPEQPCSYIYDQATAQPVLTCSDPTQTRRSLSFITRADENGTPTRRLEVPLPQGDDKGSCVTIRVPLN